MHVLVINCGSATVKLKLFAVQAGALRTVTASTIDVAGPCRPVVDRALAELPVGPDLIAHRVVHSAGRLPGVVRIDGRVLEILREQSPADGMCVHDVGVEAGRFVEQLGGIVRGGGLVTVDPRPEQDGEGRGSGHGYGCGSGLSSS